MKLVEKRGDGYYIKGSRVSLDSVVYCHLDGESPLGIVESFPSLSLAQVESAIEYYLANRAMVDAYLRRQHEKFEMEAEKARRRNPELYEKLRMAAAKRS